MWVALAVPFAVLLLPLALLRFERTLLRGIPAPRRRRPATARLAVARAGDRRRPRRGVRVAKPALL